MRLTSDEQALAVGQRIRELRKSLGMTLTELAEASSLSHSFLSLVERGRARLGVDAFVRVAQSLHTTPVDLFQEAREVAETERYRVVRANRTDPEFYTDIDSLALASYPGALVPRVVIGGESTTDHHPLQSHDGDDFIYVIEGGITVELGDEPLHLTAGDSMVYHGISPHAWSVTEGFETYRILHLLIPAP